MAAEQQAGGAAATDRNAWTREGVETVVPGVHRIVLPLPNDGLRAVNVYAIEDGDGLVLVDSGWALDEARDVLERCLATLGYDLGQISRFLVTHAHRDHYTLGVVLRRTFGSKVALGLGEQPVMEAISRTDADGRANSAARLLRYGAEPIARELLAMPRPPREDGWEMPDEWLRNEQRVELSSRTLRVLATPGHTVGHVVFVDEANSLLFAGDHVLPHITPSLGFELEVDPNYHALAAYLDSLALMQELPDLRALPAHGPVTDSAHHRVAELLDHHRVRLDETLAAVHAGARTAYEAAGLLTWTRRKTPFAKLDMLNQSLASTETGAHLDVLMLRGEVVRTTVDGVYHYALPTQSDGTNKG